MGIAFYVVCFQPPLQRMANSIVVKGSPSSIPSSCGANCSYNITFDAPWLQCQSSSTNITIQSSAIEGGLFLKIYDGYWINSGFPGQQFLTAPSIIELDNYNNNNSSTISRVLSDGFVSSFCSNTLRILEELDSGDNIVTQENITCIPARASYTLLNIYENNIPKISITKGINEKLTHLTGINITLLNANGSTTVPLWNPDSLAWHRDVNLWNLIGVTLDSLAGSYISDSIIANAAYVASLNILQNTGNVTSGVAWGDSISTISGPFTLGPLNGALIANSQFNDFLWPLAHSLYTPMSQQISFTATEELLNNLLLNVTLSAITAYGWWNTTVNATVDSLINIYSFSKPANLLLPYGLSLLFSLPFIILGLWALYENSVSATDGGFIQLISTSTGSSALKIEAVKGCLGGEENVPEGLKELEVRFGELRSKHKYEVGGKRRKIGRAGFGVESEIIPLKKRADYGVVDEGDGGVGWV